MEKNQYFDPFKLSNREVVIIFYLLLSQEHFFIMTIVRTMVTLVTLSKLNSRRSFYCCIEPKDLL